MKPKLFETADGATFDVTDLRFVSPVIVTGPAAYVHVTFKSKEARATFVLVKTTEEITPEEQDRMRADAVLVRQRLINRWSMSE